MPGPSISSTVFDPLPSIVIAHMLGVPEDLEDRFRIWSDELLEAQNAGGTGALSDAHPEFARFVQGLISDHRAMDDPPDDVVTRFINTDVDGEYLSDRAVRTQIMFLIVAGNETTRNLIGNCLYVLATRPDLFDQIRRDHDLIPRFVEESLRLDAPVQVLARSVLDDTEIEGCPLHARRSRGVRGRVGEPRRSRLRRPHRVPPRPRRGCASTWHSAPVLTSAPVRRSPGSKLRP